MVNSKLLKSIKENLNEMSDEWLKEVRSSEYMVTYQKLDDEEIKERGQLLIVNLAKWLQEGANQEEIEKYFESVGTTRFREKFPLTEVQFAIYITKKIIWNFIDWRDAISGAFSTSHARKILTLLTTYFDLGIFFITRAYMNELYAQLDKSDKFEKEELRHLINKGKTDTSSIDEDEFIWRPV
ncbi:MAG: hypothetical protein D6830_05975 [Ignavibacteria bacterium]|nr:MAG: hypothetical protein D6830_05975 [Ignavibacteria bacterium]